jgi:thiamine kinase-like enzyme
VHNAIDSILPNLDVFVEESKKREEEFVFTHYDLAPRNVLVSGSPPRITGIVDFELSGYFPQLEEYLRHWEGREDDWSPNAYRAFLERLDEKGASTPLAPGRRRMWTLLRLLHELEEYIAPWWMEDGSDQDGDEELADAEKRVLAALRQLEEFALKGSYR